MESKINDLEKCTDENRRRELEKEIEELGDMLDSLTQ